MMLDATQSYDKILDQERIFGWQAALFPSGWSGIHRIDTGCYRDGVIQVVSGPMGKEKIHFQAPSPNEVKGNGCVFKLVQQRDRNRRCFKSCNCTLLVYNNPSI